MNMQIIYVSQDKFGATRVNVYEVLIQSYVTPVINHQCYDVHRGRHALSYKRFSGAHNFFNSLAPGKFEWNLRYVLLKWILVIDDWGISREIGLIWVSLDFTDDQSTLVQVMAWCRQATSHYLSQCWPRSLSPYGVTRPQWVKWQIWTLGHPFLSHCSLVMPWAISIHVMACCLTAPSHYMNQCWPAIFEVIHLRAVSWEMLKMSITKLCLKITHLKSQPHLLGDNELNFNICTNALKATKTLPTLTLPLIRLSLLEI